MKPAETPGLIVVSRCCHTFAGRATQALAIAAGRVVALGTARQILALRRRGTRVLSLPNATLTPGLVDCHTHFLYWSLHRALTIDLSRCTSLERTLHALDRAHRRHHVGDWIVGNGFNHNLWGTGLPLAADLDRIIPDQPVLIRARDGHTVCLNTLGLQRASITAATPDPKGGRYQRDRHGRPTGIVQEAAVDLLPDPLRLLALDTSPAAQRTVDRALDAACRALRSLGIVAVHSVDYGESWQHLQRHHTQRRLGLRIAHAIALADFEHARSLGLRSGLGDRWLRLGGVKCFTDGSLGSQTALMFDPYPGHTAFHGVPVVAGDELKERVQLAARHGWAVWVHAIGDRAVHEAVAAIAAAGRTDVAIPHRIEHVQCIRPADARRMARAQIIASVQPCHIPGDIATAERHWPHVRQHTYAFRRLLDAGVTLAAGSDIPIESPDPRRGLWAAATRTDEYGQPAGGWVPEQRITVEEALRAYTVGAAHAMGDTLTAGVLSRGAPADITIWSDDPLRVPPERLRDIDILGSIVDGQVHLAGDAT